MINQSVILQGSPQGTSGLTLQSIGEGLRNSSWGEPKQPALGTLHPAWIMASPCIDGTFSINSIASRDQVRPITIPGFVLLLYNCL